MFKVRTLTALLSRQSQKCLILHQGAVVKLFLELLAMLILKILGICPSCWYLLRDYCMHAYSAEAGL